MDNTVFTPSKCSTAVIEALNKRDFISKDEPTLDVAINWLRCKYNIHIYTYVPTRGLWAWRAQVLDKDDGRDKIVAYSEISSTPDNALNEGIYFVLCHLVAEHKVRIKIPKKGFDESISMSTVFKKLDLSIGETVEVICSPIKEVNGWELIWDPEMDSMIGGSFRIQDLNLGKGVKLHKWWFPPHCLAKVTL